MRSRQCFTRPRFGAFLFALANFLPTQALAQCQLQCDVNAEGYKIELSCEKGPRNEKYSDRTSFEYTPAGSVGVLITKLSRELTYTASHRTYQISGTIRVDKTSGAVHYDVQATGGLLGAKTATCKGEKASASPVRVAPGKVAPPVRAGPPRERPLDLRVAGDYQAAIVVPVCAEALKNDQSPVFACFVSEPGEFIGRGKTWLLPSQISSASATVFYERVQVTVPDAERQWDFDFSTPKGLPWRVGLFENAVRDGFHDGQHPGVSISGHSRGCNEIAGRFEILELVTDAARRNILKFAANFEQICEPDRSGRSLRGMIRFQSTVDR